MFGSRSTNGGDRRAAPALQPVAMALFANSPFAEGKLSSFVSYRSHVWTDTDPNRSGQIPFAFERGMSLNGTRSTPSTYRCTFQTHWQGSVRQAYAELAF